MVSMYVCPFEVPDNPAMSSFDEHVAGSRFHTGFRMSKTSRRLYADRAVARETTRHIQPRPSMQGNEATLSIIWLDWQITSVWYGSRGGLN